MGVIGLGYVVLPLIRTFFDAGFGVIGFDVDPSKIEALHAGRNYLQHLGDDLVRPMVDTDESDRFDATADFERLRRPMRFWYAFRRRLGSDSEMKSVPLSPTSKAHYDCVLVSTNHAAYDWPMIADAARLIVDTRGVYRDWKGDCDQIVTA